MLLDEAGAPSSKPSSLVELVCTAARPGGGGHAIIDILQSPPCMQKHSEHIHARPHYCTCPRHHHRHGVRNRSTCNSARPRKHALWQVESGPHPIHGIRRAAGSRDEARCWRVDIPSRVWPWPRRRGRIGCIVHPTAMTSSLQHMCYGRRRPSDAVRYCP